jgi:lysyl-tRNA synthetase, class II
MLRLERHELGPRVYVLHRRIHEYHLGLGILALLSLGAVFEAVTLDEGTVLAGLAAAWLIVKDWQDLFPSRRDTAAWRLGTHRRPTPLRALRRADFVPALAAVAAFGAGLVTLISAATPNEGSRERLLATIESTDEMRFFHAFALPAAAVLMATAIYLYRRRRGALAVAVFLLVTLGVLNLAKGLDVEEAAVSFAAAGLLWWSRDSFYVHQDPVSLRSAVWRVPAVALGTAALVVAAVAAAAPSRAGGGAILRATGDAALMQPGPIGFHDELGLLPYAISFLVVLALLTIAYLIFRPLAAPRALPDARVRKLARNLVLAHGRDTLAYFKLRRDKHYLFSSDRAAFLGYRIENGVMVVSGDPVGSRESTRIVVGEAVRFAERRGLKLAAVGVGKPALALWEQTGARSLYIGDEAIVETNAFSLDGRAIRKVRQSVSRLENAGYTLDVCDAGRLDARTLAELERVSSRWRDGAPERGFSMAMDSLAGETIGSVVVLARDRGGTARGFVHFVPTYGRRAMSLSFMRRDPATPNGLMEFLVARSIELLRDRGVDEVSLNFAAFARVMHSPRGRLDRVIGRLVALANPYFQIESLYRFNAKFFPRWEPRYLVYEGPLGLPRAALAVMWVEGQLPRRPTRRRAVPSAG